MTLFKLSQLGGHFVTFVVDINFFFTRSFGDVNYGTL